MSGTAEGVHPAVRRDGVQFDLRFDATMDVANAGFPDGSEEWGPNHYEQGGRITGSVYVDGEQIPVDCGSNRDHSWGPRLYKHNPRGDFPWFNDGKGFAFQMYNVGNLPQDNDPIVGTTEPSITGWIQREDKVANIVTGSRTVLDRRTACPGAWRSKAPTNSAAPCRPRAAARTC